MMQSLQSVLSLVDAKPFASDMQGPGKDDDDEDDKEDEEEGGTKGPKKSKKGGKKKKTKNQRSRAKALPQIPRLQVSRNLPQGLRVRQLSASTNLRNSRLAIQSSFWT